MIESDLQLASHNWRIVASKKADRYGHSIECRHGDRWIAILTSEEGASDVAWPTSPPVQQLVLDELSSGRFALLGVGMAGTSHWSLSFHLEEDTDVLQLDFACRLSQEAGWLGTTYRLGPEVKASEDGVFLRLHVPGIETICLECDAHSRWKLAEGQVQIEPKQPLKTARWMFRAFSPRRPVTLATLPS